jgi:membrane protease YdiL (CAAX protease family)
LILIQRMALGTRGKEASEQTMKLTLQESPWTGSILFVCIFMAILWLALYGSDISIVALRMWPFFVVLLLLLLDMKAMPDKEEVDNPRIAVVAIAWIYLMIFFGGNGIYSYVAFDEYIFEFLLLLGPILLLWSINKLSPSSFGLKRGNMTYSLCFVFVAIGYYGISSLLILFSNMNQIPIEGIADFLILSSLLPAIIEEMIFRGMIQDRLSKMLSSELSGVMVTTLFFGLGHIWTDAAAFEDDIIAGFLATFFYQFIGGLVFAVAYSVTRSIFAPVVIHFLSNAASWLHTSSYVSQILPISILIEFAGAIICLAVVWFFLRKRRVARRTSEFSPITNQNPADAARSDHSTTLI